MKAVVVYGCPCSGKSTYIREHAGDADIIYDYDAMLLASTTREHHLTQRHAGHWVLMNIREAMINNAVRDRNIDALWIQCRWLTDNLKEMLEGVDTEEVFISATKEECYDRLMQDDRRPDKDEWKAVIDVWFQEHGSGKEENRRDMKKFWNFFRNDEGERILRLEGPIDEDSFWGNEITPKAFRDELEAEEGDVTVWVNSPGGNVFAAAEIYTMLCDHKGKITVKIDAIAASAASVVAMAGDRVLMSPVAMLMIHDPMTIAMGNAADMEKAISTLNEVRESIINAYAKKTGLSRNKIARLMSDETWMNAKKAVEMGFADEVLFSKKDDTEDPVTEGDDHEEKVEATIKEWQPYSTRIMGQTILNRLCCAAEPAAGAGEEPDESSGEAQDVEPPEAGVKDDLPEPPPVTNDPVEDAGQKKTQPGGNPDEEEDPDEGGNEDPDDPDSGDDPDEDDPDDPDKDDDPGKRRQPGKNQEDPPTADKEPDRPVIGMDGRTKDGAMPYELLKKQLDFLR